VIAVLTVGIPTPPEIGQNAKLNCYPNPFSREVTISFNLEERSTIALQVFNNMGQLVAALADEIKEAGHQRIIWNSFGLPAGMYYFRLTAGPHIFSGKAIKNH
jgi:hypothetical protein